MSSQAINKSDVEHEFKRELGTYGGQTAGPLVICICGIHGNEPAGALALQRVLRRLHEATPPFKGEMVAFAGNLRALNGGTRYLSRDLNRMWTPERLDLLKDQACEAPSEPEELEQRELLAVIWSALTRKRGDVRLFWLKVSAWMRHRKLDRILPWLPGVNPSPDDQSALVIDTRVARWFVIEICHLLGFRKHSQEQGRLIVRRRRQSPEHRNGTA